MSAWTETAEDYKVQVEYFAVPNGNERLGGFVPRLRVTIGPTHTREMGDAWSSLGLGQDEAIAQAKRYADEEAGRYGGDYKVTVSQGEPKGGR